MPRRRSGPELCVITSSTDWRNSNAQASGGVSCAKLSQYLTIGAHLLLSIVNFPRFLFFFSLLSSYRYKLWTLPPLPTIKYPSFLSARKVEPIFTIIGINFCSQHLLAHKQEYRLCICGSKLWFIEIRTVGGQPCGNARMRIRKVS